MNLLMQYSCWQVGTYSFIWNNLIPCRYKNILAHSCKLPTGAVVSSKLKFPTRIRTWVTLNASRANPIMLPLIEIIFYAALRIAGSSQKPVARRQASWLYLLLASFKYDKGLESSGQLSYSL